MLYLFCVLKQQLINKENKPIGFYRSGAKVQTQQAGMSLSLSFKTLKTHHLYIILWHYVCTILSAVQDTGTCFPKTHTKILSKL
mmetsp:Transcript_30676/g.47322  ORF Transcript_30676/g.47322 Transcript_30676/m.47322 type:complete len:84 (+) Transcript_30676:25-276(+)